MAALGAEGLFHPINATCANSEGEGRLTFQQRDSAKWKIVSDRIKPN